MRAIAHRVEVDGDDVKVITIAVPGAPGQDGSSSGDIDPNVLLAITGKATRDLTAHRIEWRNVHGIRDTSQIVYDDDPRLDASTFEDEIDQVAEDLAAHEIAQSGVHGIPDVAALVLSDDPRLNQTPTEAGGINYDHTTSGLAATKVQGAVDELASKYNTAVGPALDNIRTILTGGSYWYAADYVYGTDSSQTQVLNRLNAYRFTFPNAVQLKAIGINIQTTVATAVVRCGVYADLNGLPGALVAEIATLDAHTATGAVTFTLTPLPLNLIAGRYWFATVAQTAASKCTSIQVTNLGGSASFSTTGSQRGAFAKSNVTGALPDPFGAPDTVGFSGAGVWAQIV